MNNINIKVTMSDTEAALRSRLLRRNAENAELRDELDAAYVIIAKLSDELKSAQRETDAAKKENSKLRRENQNLQSALNSYCIAMYVK